MKKALQTLLALGALVAVVAPAHADHGHATKVVHKTIVKNGHNGHAKVVKKTIVKKHGHTVVKKKTTVHQ